MNAFLSSIGYSTWALPALLLIPLLGAAAIWVHGAMQTLPHEDEVTSGAVVTPRLIALVTFAVEFAVSIGFTASHLSVMMRPSINLRRARLFWPCATKISPVRTVGRHQASDCTLNSLKWTTFRNSGAWSA